MSLVWPFSYVWNDWNSCNGITVYHVLWICLAVRIYWAVLLTDQEDLASLLTALLKWWMLVCKSGRMSLMAKKLIRKGLCRERYTDVGRVSNHSFASAFVGSWMLFAWCYDDQVSWSYQLSRMLLSKSFVFDRRSAVCLKHATCFVAWWHFLHFLPYVLEILSTLPSITQPVNFPISVASGWYLVVSNRYVNFGKCR